MLNNPAYFQPINLDQLQKLDEVTRNKYLEMLEMMPEPDWQESLARLLFVLKQFRDSFAKHDDNTLIHATAVARLLTRIMVDPHVAGGAFEFLEHNKQALDIIALEQMMSLDSGSDTL